MPIPASEFEKGEKRSCACFPHVFGNFFICSRLAPVIMSEELESAVTERAARALPSSSAAASAAAVGGAAGVAGSRASSALPSMLEDAHARDEFEAFISERTAKSSGSSLSSKLGE